MIENNKKESYCERCARLYETDCPCDLGYSCPDLSWSEVDPYL